MKYWFDPSGLIATSFPRWQYFLTITADRFSISAAFPTVT